MIFESRGEEVVCRLSVEEADRALREGYLSLTPDEEGGLSRARRAARKADTHFRKEGKDNALR